MSRNNSERTGVATDKQEIFNAMGQLPSGLFIMTAAYEDKRMGMLASWVQQVGFEPPMLCVAVAKGRSIMPLISESHHFALCQLAEGDRVLPRKFASPSDPGDDPFLGFNLVDGYFPGLPILANAMSYFECELTCHMDVEADHDLFIGKVMSGRILNPGKPVIHLRNDGSHY